MNKLFIKIPGYSNYFINSNGEIYSKLSNKMMKTQTNRYGYLQVMLYNNHKGKLLTIHRLVAQTFIPNPENLPQVNHKNGVKTDNRVENLEFCTAAYNNQHAWDNGLKEKAREVSRNYNIKRAQEACTRHLDYQLIQLFDDIFINPDNLSERKIAAKHNVSRGVVSNIKRNRSLKVAINEYFGRIE